MSAAPLDTSVPAIPIATPMSARFRAGASLTPSPVMATTSPCSCSASTIRSLCSGLTRGRTRRPPARRAPGRPRPSPRAPAPATARAPPATMPSSTAIAAAVAGWSPVIMIVRIPASRASRTARCASGRGGSIIPTTPSQTSSLLELHVEAGRRPPRARGPGRPRPGCAALRPRGSPRRRGWPAAARRLSGRSSFPTRSWVQRARRMSGAPFDTRTVRPPRSASVWAVLISLRSDEKGISPTRRKRASRSSVDDPGLARRHHQRPLGGVAKHLPPAVCLAERGVAREHGCPQQPLDADTLGGVLEGAPLAPQLALGPVAGAGDVGAPARGDRHPNGHLVLREGAGLVGADDGGRTERLHRGQLADDHAPPGHPLRAQGEHDGGDRGEALRHGRHREGHRQQQHRHEGGHRTHLLDEDDGHGHDQGDRDDDPAQEPSDVRELPLQRRLLRGRAAQQPGYGSNLGVGAGSGDDRATAAVADGRPAQDHVRAVAEADLDRDRRHVLRDRRALAGQRRLHRLQRHRLEDARVRGHGRALLDQQDVAGDETGGRHAAALAVAQHLGVGRREPAQRSKRLLGAALLHVAEGRVQEQHREYGERLVRQRARAARSSTRAGTRRSLRPAAG